MTLESFFLPIWRRYEHRKNIFKICVAPKSVRAEHFGWAMLTQSSRSTRVYLIFFYSIILTSRVVLDSFFRADSTLTHMTIQVTQLRLNSNPKFANLTQLWLNTKPKFTNLNQLWLNSFESEMSQIWLTTHHVYLIWEKVVDGGGGVRSIVAAGWFISVKLQIIARSWRFLFEKSVTQLWLKQYPVDSTLTQMTISVIRLWLDSYPWFSQTTRLWLDSFESESSQIWLTTHESGTTLLTSLANFANKPINYPTPISADLVFYHLCLNFSFTLIWT